jgi:head-tail adaptor
MPQPLVPVTAWPHIDPGKKRHKISIFAQSTVQDGYGQESKALGTLPALSCYAAIETFTAREVYQDGFVSQVVHKVYIDWPRSTRITVDMRLVVHPLTGPQASLYEIQAIENVQQRDLVMILTCLEIDNEQVGS